MSDAIRAAGIGSSRPTAGSPARLPGMLALPGHQGERRLLAGLAARLEVLPQFIQHADPRSPGFGRPSVACTNGSPESRAASPSKAPYPSGAATGEE